MNLFTFYKINFYRNIAEVWNLCESYQVSWRSSGYDACPVSERLGLTPC